MEKEEEKSRKSRKVKKLDKNLIIITLRNMRVPADRICMMCQRHTEVAGAGIEGKTTAKRMIRGYYSAQRQRIHI